MRRGENKSYSFLSFLSQGAITQHIFRQLIFGLWASPEMMTATSLEALRGFPGMPNGPAVLTLQEGSTWVHWAIKAQVSAWRVTLESLQCTQQHLPHRNPDRSSSAPPSKSLTAPCMEQERLYTVWHCPGVSWDVHILQGRKAGCFQGVLLGTNLYFVTTSAEFCRRSSIIILAFWIRIHLLLWASTNTNFHSTLCSLSKW